MALGTCCGYCFCSGTCGCGYNALSMSTVNVNPSTCQSVCGSDGGAGSLSSALNAVGRWGTALTGVLQGKPVATNKSGGVAVGARGSTNLPGANRLSSNSMLLILVIVLVIVGILIYNGDETLT